MTITQAFGLFLDDQFLKGNSLHTINDYTNKLRGFLEQLCKLHKNTTKSHPRQRGQASAENLCSRRSHASREG